MPWHVDSRGLEKRANKAFGEMLAGVPWEWYVTQTFKLEYVSPKQADTAYYSWFNSARVAAKALGLSTSIYGPDAPFYFRTTEYQARGTIHYHALVGGVGDIRRLSFKDLWELHGYARIEAYEPGRGANFYVGKYLTKTDSDIRFSHNLKSHLTLN